MNDWLKDSIEQICLADILGEANDGFGRRFAMIAIDNSLEFALRCYVEVYKNLVGGHRTPFFITTPDWLGKREHFEPMLRFVAGVETGIAADVDEILRFHGIRDALYHTGIPLRADASTVRNYSALAKKTLDTLFSLNYADSDWSHNTDQVRSIFAEHSGSFDIPEVVLFERVAGGIRFTASQPPKTRIAIRLLIHGYSLVEGREPTSEELFRSMTLSGNTTTRKVMASRIAEMRAEGLVRAGRLALTSRGLKALVERYSFRMS